MEDIEKVKTGLFEMLQRDTWKDIDPDRERFQPILNDALALLKILDSALVVLTDSGFDTPCDELITDDGWCDEHCTEHGQTKDCWLRYFSKIAKDGEQDG